ncbi:MAG: zf-HC2 domain-containing protein [Pseudomonadota bacterium]
MNHSESWDLIPWVVNGRASAQQCARLEQHMEQCPLCRAEVESQRALMQAMQTRPTVESMPHASLQKLWARIDGGEADVTPAIEADAPRPRRPAATTWLAAAVAAQALLLGVLSFALLNARSGDGRDQASFRTVSTPSASTGAPAVRAVFAPEMKLGDLQALLERAHLRIVNGPSAEGVLTLAVASTGDDAARALAVLRASPAARFAEPIGR